jgi:uncharacterized protein
MSFYVYEYSYVDADLRAAVRPRHMDYIGRLNAEGRVVMAGPLADGSGALIVYRAADEEEARRLVDEDPYTVEGVTADRRIREWTVVIPAQP